MTRPAPSRFLHVANGSVHHAPHRRCRHSRHALHLGRSFYDGPVPGGLTDAELIDVRARHLAGPAGQARPPIL